VNKKKIKLLYVTDGIFPGVVGGLQKVSFNHIKMLQDKVNLSVVYSGSEDITRFENVQYFYFPWPDKKDFWRINNYVNQLKLFSQHVVNILSMISPDVIYTDGPLLNEVFKQYKQKNIRRLPVIYHPHGLGPYQDNRTLVSKIKSSTLRPIIRKHCLSSDIVISQGGKLSNILSKRIGVQKKSIHNLSNFVETGSVAINDATYDEKNIKVYDFIFVGRNDKCKGLDFLFTTLKLVKKRCRILIVGAEKDAAFVTKCHEITWHKEEKSKEKLAELYHSAKFLILPSFVEGMPTVVLEAMSLGVPALCSDVGAVSEIVQDSENGFIFKAGDENALIKKIGNVISLNDTEYAAMCLAAGKTIRQKFTSEIVEQQLLNLIESSIVA